MKPTTNTLRPVSTSPSGRRRARLGVRPLGLLLAALATSSAFSDDAAAQREVHVIREPVILDVRFGSPAAALDLASQRSGEVRSRLAAGVATIASTYPGRVLALRPADLPLDFHALPVEVREAVQLASREAPDTERWYAETMAVLLDDVLRQASEATTTPLTVAGLPIEASHGGLEATERHAAAYAALAERLDAILTERSFIVSRGTNELALAEMALPRAFGAAGSRPVLFQTNRTWRAALPAGDAVALGQWQEMLLALGADDDSLEEFSAEASRVSLAASPMPDHPSDDVNGAFASDGVDASSSGGGLSSGGGSSGSAGGGSSGGGGGGGGSGGGGGGGSGGGSGGSGDIDEDGGGSPGIQGGTPTGGGGGGGGGGGSDVPPAPPAPVAPVAHLTTTLTDPPAVVAQYGEWNVERSYLLTGWGIDPEAVGEWTEQDRTQWWLDNYVPVGTQGFICLDWEEGALEHLWNGPSDPMHSQIVSEMIELLTFVKSQRPQAKVGMYAVPLREYWEQDAQWDALNAACQPIIDASTGVFPSCYDFYGLDPERDHERFGNYVRVALEMAAGKPVALYTWHRYHLSTDQFGFYLIPAAEYIAHIDHLLNIEHDGVKPAAVVAWGADDFYFQEAFATNPGGGWVHTGWFWNRIREAFNDEMEPGQTIEAYLTELYPLVYSRLAAAIAD